MHFIYFMQWTRAGSLHTHTEILNIVKYDFPALFQCEKTSPCVRTAEHCLSPAIGARPCALLSHTFVQQQTHAHSSCAYIVQWLSGFMLQLFIPKCQQVMKHICGWKLLFQLYGKSFILLLKLNFFGSSSKMAWHCTPLHSEWMIHLSWDIFKSLSNVKHIFRSWNVQFNLLVL